MATPKWIEASQLENLTDGLLSAKRAYTLVSDGVLRPPAVTRLGRRLFFNADEVLAFIEAGGSGLPGGTWKRAASGEAASEAAAVVE